jgi:hypothetical protein
VFRPDREFARKVLKCLRVSTPENRPNGPESKNSLLFWPFIVG